MKIGVVDPYRFNDRMGPDGYKIYDAITTLHFFGEVAWAVGLTDTLEPRYVKKMLNYLASNEVTELEYYSKGERITWRRVGKRWGRIERGQ
jgi:hypothetical protein